ncbi:nineteen complex-related protein 2-domain-containing protein [Infundibulicybe gibba]|nr:nineteen complex-related protein 2-domain-containing protein [Infundibulicybe gibba]
MSSTNPPIFKRTKSKPAQRSRQQSPDNDGEKNSNTAEDSPSTIAAKLKNKVKKSKPKSRLSFGVEDDEGGDGEVFQIKKSNLSRKLALGKHPANLPDSLHQASITPNRGPTYNEAYLNELKASTPTSRPPTATTDPYSTDMSVDVDDVSMSVVEQSELPADVGVEAASLIPSESSIKVAKERRERLRKTVVSGGEDYISLSVTRRADDDQGPHPDSRLVREEDELGEGDDEFAEYTNAQERIALGKKSRKAEASKRRDAMKEMIADAEEQDDETVEWEQEQLRRGGHRTPERSPAPKPKEVYKPTPIPQATPIPTLSLATDRLSQQLTKLTISHANNTSALSSLAQERGQVEDREKEMREMVGRAEEKRAWFGSFKEWIEGVASFLDEKYPLLEKLEDEHISLLKERSGIIAKRRRAEDEDDLSVVYGPLPMPEKPQEQMEERDEWGNLIPRPTPAVLRRERQIARAARRQRRQAQTYAINQDDQEGYSTDSSLDDIDATAYTTALESLALRKKEVLADVRAEEFRNPGKGRWGAWRDKYNESYVGAWGGLGVVSVWEFWMRLEVVGWDCIEVCATKTVRFAIFDRTNSVFRIQNLDSFDWYKGLYEYSRPGGDDEQELSPDGDLVASMISTAVIPRICKLLEGGALDALVEEVEASIDPGNAKIQVLLKSAVAVFESAIADTEDILATFTSVHHGATAFNPEAIPARRRFLARRIKLLRNMVQWRKFTGERFGMSQLITKLADGPILVVADSGWEVGGEAVARHIAEMLPNDLIINGLIQRLGR